MMYGKYFLENATEDAEIDVRFDIQDKLDKTVALDFAEALFKEWKEEHEENDEEDEDDLTIEDFYDSGWEVLSETYYGYLWSQGFIEDCINYYRRHSD